MAVVTGFSLTISASTASPFGSFFSSACSASSVNWSVIRRAHLAAAMTSI